MKNLILRIVILLSFMMVLTACGDKAHEREVKQYVEQTRLAAKNNKSTLPPIEYQLPKPIKYSRGTSAIGSTTNKAVAGKPLLNYPLKSLKFVGTMSQNRQTWVYIMTPDNMIYGAKEGDKIGNTYGKIIKIAADHIVVNEPVTEGGKPMERKVTMELKE